MRFRSQCLTILLFPAYMAAVVSCGSDSNNDGSGNLVLEGVSQITLGGLTTRIDLATANKEGTGFIVASVNAIELGSLKITGENNDVTVFLNRPLIDNESVTVTLHDDTNSSGIYESGTDLGMMSIGGGFINASSLVSVPALTPDVRIDVINNGNSSWLLNVDQNVYEGWGSLNSGANPALQLREGLRYEIVNPATATHPFSLVTLGATAGADIELITQGGTGSLYSDTTVNVVENGTNKSIQFTLSSVLTSLTGYRCNIHTGTMRSTLAVLSVL